MASAGTVAAASALFLALSVAGHATAAACSIEHAVFAEAETGIELRFFAASGENTPVSHGFEVAIGDLRLDGHVMYDETTARPQAMLTHNCPEGDVTGADIAACTVWSGYVYGADGRGNIEILAPEGSEAPQRLLLPGLGPALKASPIGGAIGGMPWDVYEFKHCVP